MLDERELRDVWYGPAAPRWTVRALAGAYAALMWLRRLLYAWHLLPRKRLPVALIVVGNVTVGGTGKTPLTIALVEALRARGFNPGVVSRGYGVPDRPVRLVDRDSDPAVGGDEPCLIARATGVPVAIGADRVAAGRLLLGQPTPPDVLIADDGLQHYRLCRDVEICVIDGERRFGNNRLLPAGPLREPAARADLCDFRVVNGGAAHGGEIAMTLVGDAVVALADSGEQRELRAFSGRRVHAVAGIGNPARFFAQLRSAGIDPVEHAFGDHHAFKAHDLAFGDDLPVLMTEKDAIKCAAFADARCWAVPVRARLDPAFFEAVAARIRACDLRRAG